MRACLVGIAVIFAGCATAQSPLDELKVLVSGQNAYFFGEPRQIMTGRIGSIHDSPDGQFVACVRTIIPNMLDAFQGRGAPPHGVFSIWNTKRGTLWDVWGSTESVGPFVNFQWTRTSGIGFSLRRREFEDGNVHRHELTVERLNASTSQRVVLHRFIVRPDTMVTFSRDGQRLLMATPAGAGELLDLITGKRSTVPNVPEGASRYFEPDGTLVLSQPKPGDKRGWQRLDAVSGVDLGFEPEPDEIPSLPFVVSTSEVRQKGGRINVLEVFQYEEEESPKASSAAKQGRTAELVKIDPTLKGPILLDISPSQFVHSEAGKCVYYSKPGGLYVCPYESINVDLLEKLVRRRVQDRAMENAGQVATAMMLYAGDYDDMFPPNDGWEHIVLPYIKQMGPLNGFTYALNGTLQTSLKDTASTMLGSVDTPYGRAVAYADGHVQWVPGSAAPPLFLLLVSDERRQIANCIKRVDEKSSTEPVFWR